MRSVSLLAVAVAAFSVACGGAPTESGNAFVSEQALENVTVGGISVDFIKVTPVQVDSSDPGCSVDGMRFNSCTVAYDPGMEFEGVVGAAGNLCQLQVGGNTQYLLECEIGDSFGNDRLEPEQELPAHCPDGELH